MLIVKVIDDGGHGIHVGRYITRWNPNTPYGECDITTTDDKALAKKFSDLPALMSEWKGRSTVEPYRPTDGLPNRPLSGLTIEIMSEEA